MPDHEATSGKASNRRVLLVARNSVAHPDSGGMESVLESLANLLADGGCQLGLITTEGLNQTHPFLNRFERVWIVDRTRVGRYSSRWWRETGSPGPWDSWKPGVAIGVGDAAGTMSLRRGRTYPVVVQCHGTPGTEIRSALTAIGPKSVARAAVNLLRLPTRSLFFRKCDEVWAIGPDVRRRVDGWLYAGGTTPVLLMPNAVDQRLFVDALGRRVQTRMSLGIDEHSMVLIYFGRLDRQKGIDTAIRAVPILQRDVHLLIAGSGEHQRELEHLAEQVGRRSVSFLGRLTPGELADVLAAADVFVFPTRRWEGLPMAILEAAASGLGIVTSRTARVPDELISSSRVTVLDDLSPSAVASAVSQRGVDRNRVSYLPALYDMDEYRRRHLERVDYWLARAEDSGAQP